MGKIEIDHTGSGSGITLSSDGTDLLLDGTAIGGGGGSPDLFAENYTSGTKPTATGTNAVAIGENSQASGAGAVAMGYESAATQSYSFAAAISGGLSYAGARASNSIAMGYRSTTNNLGSVAIGYSANASGNYSVALGTSRTGGTDSFAAVIDNNTSSYGATGANSIAIGSQAKATGTYNVAIGREALADGAANAFAFGRRADAGGAGSLALGLDSDALGAGSIAIGKSYASGTDSLSAGIGSESTAYGAQHQNAVALGYQAVTTADKQIALGSSTAQVKISGAYTLPTTDGTNGQVLTTDGSGAVTFADAGGGGGGGADLYAANESSPTAQPSATGTNAVAIGDSAVASGQDSVAFSKSLASGQQSFAAALSSNSASYGAQGYHSVALGERSKATGYSSIAMGFGTATASNSFAACTSNSGYASAINSFAFGTNAQASGYPSVAMGYQPEAKAEAAVSMGYRTKITSYGYGSAAFGIDAYVAVGSKMVLGGRQFSSNGDCQTGTTVLKGATTDATALQLASGYAGSSPDISNQVVLPNNSAYAFHGTIVARQQASGGTACAAWKVEGLIRREGSAGTTVLVNSATTVLDNTPSWGMALSADTTNGGLAITVTGAASTNIRWVATIHTSEVTYA